jgi:hypothetical protein
MTDHLFSIAGISIKFYELIGIIATLMVSASLCMKNIKGLRILNLAGSAIFIGYSFLINSLSVFLLNSFAVMVNAYYLIRMKSKSAKTDLFDVLFIDSIEDDILRRFVRFHGEDITRFNPSFDPALTSGTLAGAECCFILRETLPVSLIAYKRGEDGEIIILVDYVIPSFRNFKNARFFFSTVANRIASPGSVFLTKGEVAAHINYFKRMGFIETGRDGQAVLLRKVI